MDFNGLILDTCRLARKLPAVAARIRQTYPYWLIDEFQDTTACTVLSCAFSCRIRIQERLCGR